jgi:spore coat protein CotF
MSVDIMTAIKQQAAALTVEQNALRADSGNVRAVLRDQLVVRLRRRCRV